MKTAVIAAIVLVLAALWTPAARAWNCSDPLAERVDVGPTLPAGATAGDGDGQYYKGTDAANPNDYYVCQVVKPTPATTPTGGNSNATSASNSNSQAASNSSSQASAAGGKSTSTSSAAGGSATGGNATGGNSSSRVSNSGNSSNTNNNLAYGGQGGSSTATATGGNQKQTQSQSLTNSGNSTATASGNGVGNGNNSNNYSNTTNIPAAAASPYAPPSFSTATCFKGFSGGASTAAAGISFGGGKIDQNCAELEAARQSPNLLTFCTQYIRVKYVKEAGVTLEMCMQPKAVVVQQPPRVEIPIAPQPIVVNVQPVVVPAPVVNVIAPAPAPSIVVHAKPRVPRSNAKCVPRECPKSKAVWTNDSVEALPAGK